MNEEEKKAIKELTDAVNEPLEVFENVVDTFKPVNLEQCRIILNLIEKQQKEIEKLQKDKKVLIKNYDKVLGTFIAKDKIREAIKNREIELYADNPENDLIPYDKVIDTLKELLEENTNEWFRWNGIRCYFVT